MKKLINRGAYKRKTQSQCSTAASVVYHTMTAETRFTPFKADIEALRIQRDVFELCNANAANGGQLLTIARNDAFNAMLERMDTLAHKVEVLADGDQNVAAAAGFELVKVAESVTELTTPTGLTLINLPRSGYIKAAWDALPNAVNYAVETQKQGTTDWQNGTYSTNSRGNVLTGFAAGEYLNVRIYAIGRKGLKSEYSEMATVLVS